MIVVAGNCFIEVCFGVFFMTVLVCIQLTEIVIRLFGKLFFVVKKVIANAERHLYS